MRFSFLLAIILSFIVCIISLTASFFISLSLFSLFLTDSLLSQHPSLSEGFGIKLHDTNASISSLLHIFSPFVFIGIRPTTVRWRSNPQKAPACCHSGSALVWHVFDSRALYFLAAKRDSFLLLFVGCWSQAVWELFYRCRPVSYFLEPHRGFAFLAGGPTERQSIVATSVTQFFPISVFFHSKVWRPIMTSRKTDSRNVRSWFPFFSLTPPGGEAA